MLKKKNSKRKKNWVACFYEIFLKASAGSGGGFGGSGSQAQAQAQSQSINIGQ